MFNNFEISNTEKIKESSKQNEKHEKEKAAGLNLNQLPELNIKKKKKNPFTFRFLQCILKF